MDCVDNNRRSGEWVALNRAGFRATSNNELITNHIDKSCRDRGNGLLDLLILMAGRVAQGRDSICNARI